MQLLVDTRPGLCQFDRNRQVCCILALGVGNMCAWHFLELAASLHKRGDNPTQAHSLSRLPVGKGGRLSGITNCGALARGGDVRLRRSTGRTKKPLCKLALRPPCLSAGGGGGISLREGASRDEMLRTDLQYSFRRRF